MTGLDLRWKALASRDSRRTGPLCTRTSTGIYAVPAARGARRADRACAFSKPARGAAIGIPRVASAAGPTRLGSRSPESMRCVAPRPIATHADQTVTWGTGASGIDERASLQRRFKAIVDCRRESSVGGARGKLRTSLRDGLIVTTAIYEAGYGRRAASTRRRRPDGACRCRTTVRGGAAWRIGYSTISTASPGAWWRRRDRGVLGEDWRQRNRAGRRILRREYRH